MTGSGALSHAPSEVRRASPAPAAMQTELRGVVRYLAYHTPPPEFGREAEDRLSFYVEGLGTSGRPVQRVHVEIQSQRIGELIIRDGDTVSVRGEMVRPGELRAAAIRNLTTQSELRVGPRSPVGALRAVVGGVSLLGVPAFMLGVVALANDEFGTGATLVMPSLAAWFAYWRLQRAGA